MSSNGNCNTRESKIKTFMYSFMISGEYPVRVIYAVDGSLWWYLDDVCYILGISNHSAVAARLCKDEIFKVNSSGKTVSIINESGLYHILLTSRKYEAERFRKWLTSKVLPEIRKPTMFPTTYDKKVTFFVPKPSGNVYIFTIYYT